MIGVTVLPPSNCKAQKSKRRISTMLLAASVRTAAGFSVSPLNAGFPSRVRRLQGNRDCTGMIFHSERVLPLKYAEEDDNNAVVSENDDEPSSSSLLQPLVANPTDNIRYKSELKEEDEESSVNQNSKAASQPTDISEAIKEVLSAPVVPSEDKEDEINRMQHLILPINRHKVQDPELTEATNTVISNSKSLEKSTVTTHKDSKLPHRKIDIGKRWRRLRPGQRFRFRLGLFTIAFVSLWNTIVARNYGGVITSILTGAAATTTATGFGSILRRWFSTRGFQGIAALGRSIAYGWAIFVAYPRMLDRRAKERRLKREEEALKQWRSYLKAIAEEVSRLKKELSLLDGEIRTFRREILAIRAARIESSAPISKKNSNADSDNHNSTHRGNGYDGSIDSDRILREAIVSEMAHLTRLRDDTRLALTTARKRWSEVRSKKPTSHSKSSSASAFDALEWELDIAADFEYRSIANDSSDDDPLLTGF
mmetsp:Transcript_5245/g.10834  ORF Transcript_5245/g.10834 Transcript_5245/m.10834 type:complete len:482 (-) Transcript_5245:1727-3172(-)